MLRKNSGFTLAELMVVIGILAILSAVAMPGFIGWITKHKLGTGARQVLSTIESARMRAVRERVSVGIEFQVPDSRGYRVWLDDGSGGGSADDAERNGAEPIILSGQMPAGVSISEALFGGDPNFRFNSQGFPIRNGAGENLTSGHVTLTNTRDSKVVAISLAGNASIQ
jgi:type IV fimbrial biogenesis protein FimT